MRSASIASSVLIVAGLATSGSGFALRPKHWMHLIMRNASPDHGSFNVQVVGTQLGASTRVKVIDSLSDTINGNPIGHTE